MQENHMIVEISSFFAGVLKFLRLKKRFRKALFLNFSGAVYTGPK